MERNFILALIWTLFIAVSSLISSDKISDVQITINDKIIHFLFYFLFVLLWSFALNNSISKLKIDLAILFSAVFYGIIMEVLQSIFTSTRQADLYDVIANSIGAVTGLVLFRLIRKS
ncbi:VanZ family protein [Flavobacterium sp. HXWNR69]|uniref:VanZ family protein n=1 Tax=Flavobacterium fragile TaxID=2949085 RepID=A0ABT0TDA1_9FLAO|nr:VanZ family protein [Flavobacterium sp. HXWNR69]MCL9768941.1 VanZ family protein [Flavobacterium sp. HXWNR69]